MSFCQPFLFSTAPFIKEDMMSTQPQTSMAQRSLQKLHFNHKDMDYYLSWIIGRQVFDGSDPQECLAVAARIQDGDPLSWQREWQALAGRVEEQAQAAACRGDLETARKAYLHACSYYRAPLMIMDPKGPAFKEGWRKIQACFRAAMPFLPFPIEAIEVPFQGKRLQGYTWRAAQSPARQPTILLVGGMETFAEDCFFVSATAAARRGYNLITVDLPGQGINPDQGLFLEARMGAPVRTLIDYALDRPEVDPRRLALFGFSWGGHIVLQGAQSEPRIQALVANPPMPDIFKAARAQQSGNGRGDPVNQLIFKQLAWRFGLQIEAIWPRMVKAWQYLVSAKADCRRITCPALFMAGEDEARITLELARQSYALLPNPRKQLAVLTRDEGGAAHCQIDNLPLLNRVILDWLEGVLPA
jgi:pimeloyl-ACP methyl ester carboxylesterase